MMEMDAPTPKTMKKITMGDWLKGIGGSMKIMWHPMTEIFGAWCLDDHAVDAATPEDALQALAEATCGPDTLLVIPPSTKWREAHGAEGVEELEKDAADWRAIREAMHAAMGCIGAMPTAQEFLTEYGHCYERARAVENARRRLEQTLGGVGDDATAGNLATARAQEQYLRMQHPGLFPDPDALAAAAEEPLPTSEALHDAIARAYQKTHPAPEPGESNEAGLAEGEAGVVVCRDGALVLVGRIPPSTVTELEAAIRLLIGGGTITRVDPDTPAAAETRPYDPRYDGIGGFQSVAHAQAALDPDTPAGHEVRPIETSLEEESERDATEESD